MRGHTLPDVSDDDQKTILMGYVEDFFIALNFPTAFDWPRQPPQWRQAQKLLSMTWEIGRLHLTKTAFEKQ